MLPRTPYQATPSNGPNCPAIMVMGERKRIFYTILALLVQK
jgi:hypothetical protein